MNTFTYKFNTSELNKIKNFFTKENCRFSEQQYAFFKATSSDYSATFYNTGKLVVQGKEIFETVKKLSDCFSIKIDNLSKNQTDEKIMEKNYIGVDESGKGDYFGPLIIAGVAVNDELKKIFAELGIKDSKQLSDERISQLAIQIQKQAKWSIVTINPQKYNELYSKFKNLNKLLAWGHARVIENLLEKAPECTLALSDKFANDDKVIENALMVKGKQIKMIQRTKGESDLAVAAASIIARAEFVSKMKLLSNLYKIDFPKGVSEKVLSAANIYIIKYGKDRLNEVAKLHFKTTQQI